jgi:hypothetical protein
MRTAGAVRLDRCVARVVAVKTRVGITPTFTVAKTARRGDDQDRTQKKRKEETEEERRDKDAVESVLIILLLFLNIKQF